MTKERSKQWYREQGSRVARQTLSLPEAKYFPNIGDRLEEENFEIYTGNHKDEHGLKIHGGSIIDHSFPVEKLKKAWLHVIEEYFYEENDIPHNSKDAFNSGKMDVLNEYWENIYLAKRKGTERLEEPTPNMIEFSQKLKDLMEEHNLTFKQIPVKCAWTDGEDHETVLDENNVQPPFVLQKYEAELNDMSEVLKVFLETYAKEDVSPKI